jgi:hypothetical protein
MKHYLLIYKDDTGRVKQYFINASTARGARVEATRFIRSVSGFYVSFAEVGIC